MHSISSPSGEWNRFHIGEFYNEISDYLALYGITQVVLYVEFTQFNYP